MLHRHLGVFVSVWLGCFLRQCWAKLPDLANHHIDILAMELPGVLMTERNATGHIQKMTGFCVPALDYLHRAYHFSYTLLPTYAPLGEDTPMFGRGAVNRVKDGGIDFLLGSLRANPDRFKTIDFSHSFYYASFSIMIPFPRAGSSAKRISAVIEPFDSTVWLLIPPSVVVVLVSLYVVSRLQRRNMRKFNDDVEKSLFSPEGKLNRWVTGAWCLFTFFLVQIYSSTLTSHLTSPLQKPVILAVQDIPKVAGLKFLVQVDYSADAYIQAYPFGLLKRFGDILRNDKGELRCKQINECLDKILQGGPYVYIDNRPSSLSEIANDRKKTGTCRFTEARERFGFRHTYMAVAKGHYFLNYVSMGILRMAESGLMDRWIDEYMVKTPECLNYEEEKKDTVRVRLSIQHLSGAFVLLASGFAAALAILLIERIVYIRKGLRSDSID